ncbi:hypothetical protein H0H87_003434 [Tephrocybe sp. NHM501043]|nr:hypothetical protein H0H87_003434 [Tephrocybe sp. NHM501043]
MSHYIRTIHTDFTSRASSPYAGSSAAAHAGLLLNLGDLISPSSSSSSSGAQPPYARRIRRIPAASYRSPHSQPPRRSGPPPPPRIASPSMKFDPFSDDLDSFGPSPPSQILYRTPPRTTPASLSVAAPRPQNAPTFTLRTHSPVQTQTQFDPNARSRLVAGILLNRVHAVGKPMRRRSFDRPREYVKSGLSSVVSVET